MVTAAPPAIIIVVVRVKSGTDENPTVMMMMVVVAPHASSSAKRWTARVRTAAITAAMTAAVTALYHVHDSAIGLRGIHQLSDRTGDGLRSRQAGAVHEGEATNGKNTHKHSLHDRSSLNPRLAKVPTCAPQETKPN